MRTPPDLKPVARQATHFLDSPQIERLVGQPLIIVSAPRSGSTLLFEQLSRVAGLWSIGGESHAIFREFPQLRAENARLDSMALTKSHASPEVIELFQRLFVLFMRDHRGVRYLDMPTDYRPPHIQLIEKTPRNALNIPFLLEVFPNARFLFLRRDPYETIGSLIEAWTVGLERGRFITFRDLPGWHLPGWCFLLPRGWRTMIGRSIPEIAAFQWLESQRAIMEGLNSLRPERWMSLDYASLLTDPGKAISEIASFCALERPAQSILAGTMPLSRSTVSQPAPDKWRRYEKVMEPLFPALAAMKKEIDGFCGSLS